MSTHTYMRRAVVAIAVASATAMILSACSAERPGTSSNGEFTLTTQTGPAKGKLDNVVWALPFGEPTSLDPMLVGDFSPNTVVSNLCDNLLRMNADFTFGPGVASDRKWVDPTTLVFTIRDDIKFASGNPLTPADVVFSLQRAASSENGSIQTSSFANVSSIEQRGDHQVAVKFTQPDATFENRMATVAGAVVEAAAVEKAGKAVGTPSGGVPCSGPYTLQQWVPGERIVLRANENYWDEALRPKTSTIEFRFLTDTSTLTNALASGEVDGSFEVPPTSIPQLSKTGTGTLYYGPSTEVLQIWGASKTGPLANPKARMALALAIDRASLSKVVFNGTAKPAWAVSPTATWESDPAASVYRAGYEALDHLDQNLDAARKLVAETAGANEPFTVAVLADDKVAGQSATAVQAAAKQVGLSMNVNLVSAIDYSNLFYVDTARGGIDGILTVGYVENADPFNRTDLIIPPNGLFNWIGYNNPEATAQLAKGKATLDADARAKLYVEAQKSFMADMVNIPILDILARTYLNHRVTGTVTSFAYMQMPWAATLGSPE
jgi:peptide/nickel transport system substrate-binding protein